MSFDGNFRSTLWTWEEARDFCTECLPYVDVLLGIVQIIPSFKDKRMDLTCTGSAMAATFSKVKVPPEVVNA